MKKTLIFVTAALLLGLTACSEEEVTDVSTSVVSDSVEYSEFTWPTSDIAELLPVPKSKIGYIEWEASYGFVINVAETTTDDFKSYVDECKTKGFTENYRAGDDYYYADNINGYHLSLNHRDGDIMFIRIDEPQEDLNDQAESTITPSPEVTEIPETTEAPETDNTTSNKIRPEFKEAMDSYEAFINEYCEFMKKYSEASDEDLPSMLSDYATYMSKYTNMTNQMNELEGEMNQAELQYYTEVSARVLQKLAEIS